MYGQTTTRFTLFMVTKGLDLNFHWCRVWCSQLPGRLSNLQYIWPTCIMTSRDLMMMHVWCSHWWQAHLTCIFFCHLHVICIQKNIMPSFIFFVFIYLIKGDESTSIQKILPIIWPIKWHLLGCNGVKIDGRTYLLYSPPNISFLNHCSLYFSPELNYSG